MIGDGLFLPPMKRKVLLVEDDAATCAVCAAALRMEGFIVRTAPDGLTALRLSETFEPDVVILDLQLPIANGFEVVEELRAAQARVPVIAISGYRQNIEQARRSTDFFAALEKPFDPDDLIGVTRRAAHTTFV